MNTNQQHRIERKGFLSKFIRGCPDSKAEMNLKKIDCPFSYALFEYKLSILCFEFCRVRRDRNFSNTSSEWIHRGRTICSQKRVDGTCNSFSPPKYSTGNSKLLETWCFTHELDRMALIHQKRDGNLPTFRFAVSKKLRKLSIPFEWWTGAKTATQTARTSNYEFASSRAVSRHGSQP